MMRRAACFLVDKDMAEAKRKIQQLAAPDRFGDDGSALCINRVHLKHVLGCVTDDRFLIDLPMDGSPSDGWFIDHHHGTSMPLRGAAHPSPKICSRVRLEIQ